MGRIVWFTGLSGAGKTTIAMAAADRYGCDLERFKQKAGRAPKNWNKTVQQASTIIIEGNRLRGSFDCETGASASSAAQAASPQPAEVEP